MRKLGMLTLSIMLVSMFAVVGCDDSTESHVLTGEWEMINMQQTSVYIAAEDLGNISTGDTLGGGTLGWQQFQGLGVSATVELTNEEFTLSGNLPTASDTLGNAPNVVPLEDTGTWEANEALTTFSLNGSIYQFDGTLTVDDEENPTEMTVQYQDQETGLDVYFQNPQDGNYYQIMVDEYSSTTLGFSKE
ncbi:MAG: hypothetical protein K9N46_03745 [Candidatus Marinimicrobia bacterium]|nr:hypothetical protein [Candidatus Neomarinimicrobiota bacterium]MCF7829675.1 hypothetical protein [Candidatus Neomarinimicrobiota bacterium]MCF7879835.1 hypothetical protein [Candidatus Neomarinimicrobiota bacterium]